jgi:hypothetical protein
MAGVLLLQINSGAGSEAARLKAAGNDAFKAKDWAAAIRMYRWAAATCWWQGLRLDGSGILDWHLSA